MSDDTPDADATGDAGDPGDAPPDAGDLAAIVRKPRAQDAIEALRAEGVYDSTRSVAEHGADRVAIPVVATPHDTGILETRRVDLPRRERGLEDLLADRGFTAAEIAAAPGSWAVVGGVVLADFGDVSADASLDADRRTAVGEALLELHGDAHTVLARGGVAGETRDPSPEVVAGAGETETVHLEHGTKYAVDLSRVTFSPGNKAERARMGEVVAPGERVFDMFAGVGYFALPMARAGADVTAAEIDPEAYRLLVENTTLNEVTDRLRAVFGDCRDVETVADRVVMGYYDAHEYLRPALEALVSGGTLHLHEATPEALFPERPIEHLETAASDAGRTVESTEPRVVKSHSEGVVHGVVDATID